MNRFFVPFLLFFFTTGFSQNLKSPSEFFGVPLGEEFHFHHQVLDYYNYLAKEAPQRVKLIDYGRTYENRPLVLVYVSAEKNLKNLESIQEEHLKTLKGSGNADKAIVWLSYNVHGNESVSTEASMLTIFELLTLKSNYLEETVVIIDPCINPDGRDRYVTWYNQNKNTPYQVDPNSAEHHEGWLSGRPNHYMFDLNRDWAWLTQIESQQRIKMYNQWMPHIHVDFHEQGVDNPYYFAPAAEPYNEVITKFQRDFQTEIGKNHAKYFDEKGWLYFTREVFDLLYPSYGDTYPTYNGGIGMTYEQGGSGRAGLGIITSVKDTLTLKDRIAHHHTTGLSTVEVASKNVKRLNDEFKKFYAQNDFKHKSYVLNGDEDKIHLLAELLEKHKIEFHITEDEISGKGFDYHTGKWGSFKSSGLNMIVPGDQTKQTLVKVLMEPNTKLSDSVTYDITAWSLPYAYGLNAYAMDKSVGAKVEMKLNKDVFRADQSAYAHLSDWNSMKDARFLAELLKEKIKVRFSNEPFTLNGKKFERGTLIITKLDNQTKRDFYEVLEKVCTTHNKMLTPVKTGFVDTGKDFGSSYVDMVKNVKIAVLRGEPVSTLNYGEIWHFFEQQLKYPITALDADYFERVDLSTYDVLVLPEGSYGSFMKESLKGKIKDFVGNGGKLIALGGSIKSISGDKGFGIKAKKEAKKDSTEVLQTYASRQREQIKESITGAIFKVDLDATHPLAYGYGKNYFTLKNNEYNFDFLDQGNVAYFEKNITPLSGFAGSKARKELENTLVFGVENYRRGNVIYLVDNPLFRGFWENGKLLFVNALFMVN